MNGMGSHQSAKMKNDEWLTPKSVIEKLGSFDLDPCSPVNRPWDTAKKHYTKEDDGLFQPWGGRVWLNPPYGKESAAWLDKLVECGNGIALIFARTETEMFFKYVWDKAYSVLFLKGRISFHYVDGTKANSGAPSVLIAYGKNNDRILRRSGIKGKYINLKKERSQNDN